MTSVFASSHPEARVIMCSLRGLLPVVSRACNFELEDVAAAIDRVDLWAPAETSTPVWLQRASDRAGRALPLLKGKGLGPAGECPAERDYELFVFVAQSLHDLYRLGPLHAWRERCRYLVCWIDELWITGLESRVGELERLAQFDRVFLGCLTTARILAERGDINVEYVPTGIDALRFCPWPDPPARVIDIYNMGRRSPTTHGAFMELAQERGWFYHYDTFHGRDLVGEPAEHRVRLASLVQRSRYFLANKAKVTVQDQTSGQEELGFRFFEGAAGGAVLIGDPPRADSMQEWFGWEDAVIELPYGTSELAVLDELESQPERVEAIRRRNVVHVLRRHDWAHRWQRILEDAGLEPTEAHAARRAELEARATRVEQGA
jgi:hypothetical protein